MKTSLHLLPMAALLLCGSLLLPACDSGDNTPAATQKAGKKKGKKKKKSKKEPATPTLSETEFQKQFMLLPMEAQLIVNSSLPEKEQVRLIRKELMPRTRAVAATYRQTERYSPEGPGGVMMMVAAVKPCEDEDAMMAVLTEKAERYGVDLKNALAPNQKLPEAKQRLVDEVKLACMDIPRSKLKVEKPFTPESAALEQKAIYRELTAILASEDSAEAKAAGVDELTIRAARYSMAISYDEDFYKKTQDHLVQDEEMRQVLNELVQQRMGKLQDIAQQKPLKIALDHLDNLIFVFRPLSQIVMPLYRN